MHSGSKYFHIIIVLAIYPNLDQNSIIPVTFINFVTDIMVAHFMDSQVNFNNDLYTTDGMNKLKSLTYM